MLRTNCLAQISRFLRAPEPEPQYKDVSCACLTADAYSHLGLQCTVQ